MAGNEFGGTASPSEPHVHAELTNDERMWAMLCHLSGFAGYFGVVPFASIIGPLIIWLLKRDASQFVDFHGKEALNFQITMSIAYAITIALCFVLIGFFILPFLGIWLIVLVVIAAIKASNGEYFRYPLTMRLVN